MDLHEILEALDIAVKKTDGTAIIPRNLAEDARDALQMLAAGMDRRAAGHTVWKTIGEPGEVRYPPEDYVGALLALALAGWVSAALPWLMSAAAGCMVCVTAQEMIPEAVEQDEPAGVISVVLGFALMMALDIAL